VTPMVSDASTTGEDQAAAAGRAIRIFIFKSEARPDLGAFTGDLAGLALPSQFKPWRVVAAVAPDQDPPYKLSREVIEVAIKARGFQLFRLGKNLGKNLSKNSGKKG
jgi:hypothetical protein